MAFPVRDPEGLAKRLGRIGLILAGLSVVLLAIGAIFLIWYLDSHGAYGSGSPYLTGFLATTVAGFILLLSMGVLIMNAGPEVERGMVPGRAVLLSILLFSSFLISVGIGFLVLFSADIGYLTDLGVTGFGFVSAGALIIIGCSEYRKPSLRSKLRGAILGMVSVGLLLFFGSTYLGGQQGQEVLNILIPGGLGPVDQGGLTGPLAVAGYLTVALAAMTYIFNEGGKSAVVSYLVASVGFVIFGAGVLTSNLGFLSEPIWSNSATTLEVISFNIAGSILFTVTGFVIIASGVVGIMFFNGQLNTLMPKPPEVPVQSEQPEPSAGQPAQP